jgi:hypothetical protein
MSPPKKVGRFSTAHQEPPQTPDQHDDSNAPVEAEIIEADIIDMTADEARAHTDRIKIDAEALWDLIIEAYQRRAWVALNYDTWDLYCITEFPNTRLRLPREEHTGMVASLRAAGLSIRAIASATGASVGTVHNAITCSELNTSETGDNAVPITGLNGKQGASHRRRKPKPEPEPEPAGPVHDLDVADEPDEPADGELVAVNKEAAGARPEPPPAPNKWVRTFNRKLADWQAQSEAIYLLCHKPEFAKHMALLNNGDHAAVKFALDTSDIVRDRIYEVTQRIPVQPTLPLDSDDEGD